MVTNAQTIPAESGSLIAAIGKTTPTGVKSGYRVIQILDFFREHPGEARGIDIAHAIRMPMSSTNELLKTLVGTGYLNFDTASRTYSLSLRFVTLADSMTSYDPALRGLLDAAREIHRETSESVAILVRDGARMRFVFRLAAGCGPMPSCVPIVGTAAGGAQMMTMQESQIARTVRPTIRIAGPQRRSVEVQRLLDKVEAFRAEGFALSDDSILPPGIRAIAMPVTTRATRTPLIFGFGGRRSFAAMAQRQSARPLARMVRQAIDEHLSAA